MISVLSRADVEQAAQLLVKAYRQDPAVLAFGAGIKEEKIKKLLYSYFKHLVDLALKYGVLIGVKKDDKLVGVRLFYKPEQYPLSAWASFVSSLKLAFIIVPTVGFTKFFALGKNASELEKMHPAEPHFTSEITCVDPEYQKQGIAKALTDYLFKLADEAKRGIHLVTSNPSNVPIWTKLGFEVKAEKEITKTKYWFFWRKPHG